MVELHGADSCCEKKMQGSFMGSNRFRVDMPRFVDFYLQGKLHLDDMISRPHQARGRQRRASRRSKTGEVARSVIMFN